MTQDKIDELADDYAIAYITEHTNIPVDSEKCRALVRAFVNFYKAVEDLETSPAAVRKLSTAKLAEILSKREGVERVDVAPHTERYSIMHFDENGSCKPGTGITREGPAIILVVTD